MFVDLFSALASDDAKTAAGQFGRRPWGACFAAPGWGREWMGPDGVRCVSVDFLFFFAWKDGRTVKLDLFLTRFGLDFFRFFYVFGFEAAQKRLLDGLGVETLASGSPSGWNLGMFDPTSICTKRQRIVEPGFPLLSNQWAIPWSEKVHPCCLSASKH